MRIRSMLAALAIVLVAAVPAVFAQATSLDHPDRPTFVVPEFHPGEVLRILVYGDMRFTDPSNTEDTDPRARKWLAAQVGTVPADALVITGDIPFRGSNPRDWQVFEQEAGSWAHRPHVYPAIGNHEMSPNWETAYPNFFHAFPQLAGNGFYSVLMGNVFLITLNLAEPMWPTGRQADWLRSQLDHIPAQADFVIFSMHVPLIADTQSEFIANLPSPEAVIMRRYLEARAVSTRQKFVMVYGHIHNYERFEFNGIAHIISGGGGARPYPVLIPGPQDQYHDPGFPVFNYVVLTVKGKQMDGTMYKIADPKAKQYSVVAMDHFVETAR